MTTLETVMCQTLGSFQDRIKSGSCTMSDDEMEKLMQTMIQYDNTQKMSKDQACSYLHLSRSSFDDKVRCGLIPRGQKVRGFKELMWDKATLELCSKELGENQQ